MFNNQISGTRHFQNDNNAYPTLDNVLDNNNNYDQMQNNNINNFNFTNISSAQSPIANINLKNPNSGIGGNMGNSINNKRSSNIYLKNQNEDFQNILNNSKINPKADKDSDPFDGYY